MFCLYHFPIKLQWSNIHNLVVIPSPFLSVSIRQNRMVGNFREGFFSRVFRESRAIRENFCCPLSTCKASEPRFNPAYMYFKLSSRPNSNRSLSVRVSLTAIAQDIQEIKVLRKHRRRLGTGLAATFFATLEQRPEIFFRYVDISRHSLSFWPYH